MRLVLVLFFIMSGCGPYDVHVKSDPVEVNHNVNINFEQIALYCQDFCTNDPNPSVCEQTCFTNIVTSIMQGIPQ